MAVVDVDINRIITRSNIFAGPSPFRTGFFVGCESDGRAGASSRLDLGGSGSCETSMIAQNFDKSTTALSQLGFRLEFL